MPQKRPRKREIGPAYPTVGSLSLWVKRSAPPGFWQNEAIVVLQDLGKAMRGSGRGACSLPVPAIGPFPLWSAADRRFLRLALPDSSRRSR
jgi:hypothetical protein